MNKILKIVAITLSCTLTFCFFADRIKVFSIAESIGAAAGLGALGGLAGATGGAMASHDIAYRDTGRLDDWLEFGKDFDSDYDFLMGLKNDILAGSVLEQTDIDAAVEEAAEIMMAWYEKNFNKVYTFDEAMYITFAADYEFANEIEREAAEIIKNAYNEAFSETGEGLTVADSFEYDGYYRSTVNLPYSTYKGAINKAIALATGKDESNIFSALNSDGTVSKTALMCSSSGISYFDENDIYYQSADIFTGFDIFTPETSTSKSDKSFFCQRYADVGYNYYYLIHPYIVVGNNVYISKNAACQLYWGGSGSVYNYNENFGNENFSFNSFGVQGSINLFGAYKPTIIDDDWFTRIWLDFSSGNMVLKLAENKSAYSSESKCYSALYTVTFDSSIDSSVSTGVDFKEETTSSGCTIWNYTVTGNVAIAVGSDCFYNLTDLSDTISYSEISAMQDQGKIIDSGYMMKTTAIMTADENDYTAGVDAVLNLPMTLVEYSTMVKAAEKDLTDDELNPVVGVTVTVDPATGEVVDTGLAIDGVTIDGSNTDEKEDDKKKVFVPNLSIPMILQTALNSGSLMLGIIGALSVPYPLYEQCRKIIENIWNYDDKATPPNFKFYYDSNGDGEQELYNIIDLSFLETKLTNENMDDKSWFSTPIRIIDLIRWLIAVVVYGLFAMRLIKRLPSFYGY